MDTYCFSVKRKHRSHASGNLDPSTDSYPRGPWPYNRTGPMWVSLQSQMSTPAGEEKTKTQFLFQTMTQRLQQ